MDHAEIPSCAECVVWLFNKDWKPTLRLGQRQPRGNAATPCWKCPKGPKPFEKEPTRKTLLAIEYYHLCAADDSGFLLPRDRPVLDNNALIQRIRDRAMAQKLDSLSVLSLLMVKGGK